MLFEIVSAPTKDDAVEFADFATGRGAKNLPVASLFEVLVEQLSLVSAQLKHYTTILVVLVVVLEACDTEAQ